MVKEGDDIYLCLSDFPDHGLGFEVVTSHENWRCVPTEPELQNGRKFWVLNQVGLNLQDSTPVLSTTYWLPCLSNWVAAKERNLSYHNLETTLFTIFPCIGILNQVS